MLWLLFTRPWGAPFRWVERRADARRQHELALATIAAESQARIFEAIGRANAEAIRELAAPLQANARVLTSWLEGFKTVQVPTSQVITEETELGWEADAAREVLARDQAETHELLKSALPGAMPTFPAELPSIPWDSGDGRVAPPIAPDFFN